MSILFTNVQHFFKPDNDGQKGLDHWHNQMLPYVYYQKKYNSPF